MQLSVSAVNEVSAVIRQHLIDPETCIRCNTCEDTCPSAAITNDGRNYVVDAAKCTLCMSCIQPCPTGAIDNWRMVPRARAYGVPAQLGWDSLPDPPSADELAAVLRSSKAAWLSFWKTPALIWRDKKD